jgi:23S rRNA (guanosine2251-2'-O)-methyltransferase
MRSRIVAGPHAVLEALKRGGESVQVVYFASGAAAGRRMTAIKEAARSRNARLERIDERDLDALAGEVRHQGVAAVAGAYTYVDLDTILRNALPRPLLLALDQVTDPHNFGAMVRSAVALGADGVIVLRKRACPVTPAVVRASAGATEHARIARVANLSRALLSLRERGLQVVGLDEKAEREMGSLGYPSEGRVLVVGSEGSGLRRLVRNSCDELVRIRLKGPVSSLNASVAAGIALYESARRRGLA